MQTSIMFQSSLYEDLASILNELVYIIQTIANAVPYQLLKNPGYTSMLLIYINGCHAPFLFILRYFEFIRSKSYSCGRAKSFE